MEGGRCADNRTFATDADMMALYRAIYKKDRWLDFKNFSMRSWHNYFGEFPDLMSWLFCLKTEKYEDRCFLVAQWLEEKK
jgi:hypothetical protein